MQYLSNFSNFYGSQQDGRMSMTAITKEPGVSVSTARNRTKAVYHVKTEMYSKVLKYAQPDLNLIG